MKIIVRSVCRFFRSLVVAAKDWPVASGRLRFANTENATWLRRRKSLETCVLRREETMYRYG